VVFLGPASVAASGASQGFSLAAGTTYTDGAWADAWYGIAANGSAAVVVFKVTLLRAVYRRPTPGWPLVLLLS
jgi:hypothetical protein